MAKEIQQEELTRKEKVPRQISIKKIEANRRNALRSTGPSTAEGKSAVRWNALKHGLLAREVLILVGDGKENASDFEALLTSLQNQLQPEGTLEEMLVEKIAVCYWRLHRALRAEIGEIRKNLDQSKADHDEAVEKKILQLQDPGSQFRQIEMRNTARGLKFLLDELNEIREEVESSGKIRSSIYTRLSSWFGMDAGSVTRLCRAVAPVSTDGQSTLNEILNIEEPVNLLPGQKTQLIAIFDQEKRKIEALKSVTIERESQELDSHRASLQLPSKEAVDKILRYETTIERQLYRALDQLDRLQRRRGGEFVPPPINLTVSSEN